ncbi:hypothetical protein D3C80_555930 [compost metagenome]
MGRRIERQAISLGDGCGLFRDLRQRRPRVKRQGDVLRHRQRFEQREMLENHAYAETARLAGRWDHHWLSFQ